MENSLVVMTHVTDEEHPGFHLFRRTAEAHGLRLRISVSPTWRSWLDGLIAARNVVAHTDAEIFMWLDGYDTIILADEAEILEKYNQLEAPFLIGTESRCWPDPEKAGAYRPGCSKWQYVNAGGYIGHAASMREVLNVLRLEQADGSTQRLFTGAYLQGRIERDDGCEIFQSCSNVEMIDRDFVISGGRLFNLATNSHPCVLHFNGRNDPTEYIKRLGL